VAHDLNLKHEWTASGVAKVSWTDTYLPEFESGAQALYVSAAGIWVIVFLFMTFSGGLGFVLVAIIGFTGILTALKMTRTRPNSVTISSAVFKAGDFSVATNRVTRIDYGQRSQWTGYKPQDTMDPMEIRVWIDDDANHVISTNSWQPQVNLRIRNALEKALLAVRAEKNEAVRAKASGPANEYGIPDY